MAKIKFNLVFLLGAFLLLYAQVNCFQLPEFQPEELLNLVPSDVCTGDKANNKKSYCNEPEADQCKANGIITCVGNKGVFMPCDDPQKPYCYDEQVDFNATSTTKVYKGEARCSKDPPLDPATSFNSNCTLPTPSIDFSCMQKGILPDPENCKIYYFCSALDAIPNKYECPNGYAFDPSLSDLFPCRYTKNAAAYCIEAKCGGLFGSKVIAYPNFNATLGQIGAYCFGNAGQPFVYRCGPNSQFQGVDSIFAPNCTIINNVQCSTDGQRFLDASNPNRYYVCFVDMDTNKYAAKSVSCPSGFIFNAKQNDCVADLDDYVKKTCTYDNNNATPKFVC